MNADPSDAEAAINDETIRADIKGFCASIGMSVDTWQLDVLRAVNRGEKIQAPKARLR